MRPRDFKRWRKSLGLSQKEAADSLGLKRRVVQYYEKGERDGKDVDIPKSVRLACYALTEGISDYHGPREPEEAQLIRSRDTRAGFTPHTEHSAPEPHGMNGSHNGKPAKAAKPAAGERKSGKSGKDKAKASRKPRPKSHDKGHRKAPEASEG